MSEQEELTGLQKYRARIVAEKRRVLTDAAADLFLEKGYDQTSLEDVAVAAAVSSATLYKHFPTKAALFGGIMEHLWETGPDSPADPPEQGDPRTALAAIGSDYAALLGQPRTVALFRVIIAEAVRFPELGKNLYERGKKPYLDRLNGYLAGEVARGRLEIDDVALASRQFLGMINDIVFWPRLLIVDLQVDEDEVRKVVASAVDVFLVRYQTRE